MTLIAGVIGISESDPLTLNLPYRKYQSLHLQAKSSPRVKADSNMAAACLDGAPVSPRYDGAKDLDIDSLLGSMMGLIGATGTQDVSMAPQSLPPDRCIQ